MGNSQVASYAGDVNRFSDNPALFDSTASDALGFTYTNLPGAINQAYAAYARIIDSFGIVSGHVRYIGYGTFTETDETGAELGTFTVSDLEVAVNYTRPLGRGLYAGASVKHFLSNYYRFNQAAIATDFGLFYMANDNLQLGFVADNIGMRYHATTGSDLMVMKPSFHIALSNKLAKAPLRFGVQYNHLEQFDLGRNDLDALNIVDVDPLTKETRRKVFTAQNILRHFSVSAIFEPTVNFNILLGYDFRRRFEHAIALKPGMSGMSAGFVVKLNRFTLQYAIVAHQLRTSANYLSITTKFTDWIKPRLN
ncbi:MAG: hypothetical protein Kow0075_03680 [Salibacteraceae bacterium]